MIVLNEVQRPDEQNNHKDRQVWLHQFHISSGSRHLPYNTQEQINHWDLFWLRKTAKKECENYHK